PDIEAIMVTFDIGRLPVVDQGNLIGIVTRTDVLRQLHQDREHLHRQSSKMPLLSCLLPDFRHRLHSALWNFLEKAGEIAARQGWHLYLVGGAVRDLLLIEDEQTLLLQDIDLVVDGFHTAAEAEAGVHLARQLQDFYPQARLSVHGEFQTAALLWHKDPDLGSLWVDIATARTEFYPYPAANPIVEASSIRQDLYRRDFTVNALALRLTAPNQGELLDFFGGMLDLRSRLVRVLHANSFIEDPTRIYRAVRFAVRLKFAIESQTETYIRYAIESGVYEKLRLEKQPAPALTTRLKAELNIILDASYWQEALRLLSHLGALKCLHSQLELNPKLWQQLRYISRWLKILQPRVEHWLVRLLLILAALPEQDSVSIAKNLQLSQPIIEVLQSLETAEKIVITNLPSCNQPSQIVQLLRPHKPVLLMAIAARNPRTIRRQIWNYLTQLSEVKPILNGEDLKKLGYKPGPQFKIILEALLMATLDREIGDR
ncbi:MAG: CBS domain-containing protein, partial [Microcystaceae cyanobacterium]